MKTDSQLKVELGVKFLEKMMSEHTAEPEYVLGFAHGLMVMGAITLDRFKEIGRWAEDQPD